MSTKKLPNKYIGLDPDVDKSGVALKQGDQIWLGNLKFFELFDYLLIHKGEDLIVIIEGGWLNKTNWHKKTGGSAALNAKIGSYVGANHETGKKIVEMMEYLGIAYKIIRPTKTKYKDKFFRAMTGISYRTNQEQRDALMLIFGLK